MSSASRMMMFGFFALVPASAMGACINKTKSPANRGVQLRLKKRGMVNPPRNESVGSSLRDGSGEKGGDQEKRDSPARRLAFAGSFPNAKRQAFYPIPFL